ncbi:MAG TPA: thiamine-phosphate kinase, partial [Candidatus Bathyarchaeia archaeon]|nr:thiamine-phosphate kinase [Candidatus Bathyarchaeia archaeon]
MKNLTEREIIQLLVKQFGTKTGVPLDFDDDVAALPLSPREWIIIKADMLVASTDVPAGMSLREAARKAVVATVSDFAAKGVRPRALMVSLGLPGPAKKETVRQIAKGLQQASREYDCKIIGGDTNQAEDLVIDIAGVGITDPKRLVQRNGAKPGDIVAVTGPFGRPAAGLRILLSGSKRDHARFPSLVRAVLHPMARLREGMELARTGAVTSSIDSSDGLAWSLYEIARASRVHIEINQISTDQSVLEYARKKKMPATKLALYGGEEYELVTTIKP